MTPSPSSPCRSCKGTEFWRMVKTDGTPLYPDSPWVCSSCHPSVQAEKWIERVSAEEKHD